VVHVIFVTQLVDPDDPVLGFVIPQIRALAARVDRVTVVANEVRSIPSDLPAEVVSLGKERARGRLERGARYEAILARSIPRRRPAALLAHMCPSYLTLAAPACRLARTPTVLWYLHASDSRGLRTAERLADAVITAFPGSYPRRNEKVHAIGHAIDTAAFDWSPVERNGRKTLRLLAVGRTSPVKGYAAMIRAVADARARGANVELRIVGPSVTPAERAHRPELERLADRIGEGGVHLEPGVPRAAMPVLLHEADVLVNATDDGSADKVVFEAMASGRPAIVGSPAFADLTAASSLALDFRRDEPGSLAGRIEELASASDAELTNAGLALRRCVQAEHSVEHWADRVAQLVSDLAR
jgi:glycosyltransferase involved in cell wall biosynthesis